MKKYLASALAALLVSVQLPAGNFVTTGDGYAIPANEISVSYGRASVPGFVYTMGGVLGTAFTGGYARMSSSSASTGAIGVEYMRYVHPHVAVGGLITYEDYLLGFDSRTGTDADGEAVYSKGPVQSHHTFTVMPSVKFPWFSRSHVSMYSKLGAGLAFEYHPEVSVSGTDSEGNRRTETEEGGSQLSFAFQANPVGVDFGGDLARGFAEIGWGYQGLVMMGVRFRF